MELIEIKSDEIYCDSSAVAMEFNKNHSEIVKGIKRLKIELLEFDLPYCKDDYGLIEIEKVYRGQKYKSFGMTRGFFILLSTRIKSENATNRVLIMISSIFRLEKRISDLQEPIQDNEFLKKLWNLDLLTGPNGVYNQPEKAFQLKVTEEFAKIFPDYDFIKSEYVLPDRGKVDIYAEEKDTGRPVLIELKIGNKSGHHQLRSYNFNFDNKAILINLSSKPVSLEKRVEGIEYLIY